MRILAIETATEACSVALIEKGVVLDSRHEILGRGHVERLVPMISELPDRGRAQEIRVSLGPGSFTGTRIGIAVARALGIAWGAEVLGYPTLSLVAQMNRLTGAILPGATEVTNPPALLVCMNGGHGEWFVQPFSSAGTPSAHWAALSPEAAIKRFHEPIVVGSRADEFVAQRGWGDPLHMLPDAQYIGWIAPDQLTARLTPIYGRGPDARLPG